MIKINLVAEAPTAAASKKRRRPEFSLGAKQGDVILLITILVAAVVVGGRWWMLDSKRDALRVTEREKTALRDELKPYIDKVEELEAKREALKHKIEVINELKNNQRGPVRIMDEVSRALPELVWLTQLTTAGTTMTIQGMAMDENAIANFIGNLYASPFVSEEPKVKSITRTAGDVFSFTFNCTFTYAPSAISRGGSGSPDASAGGGA
jgi:type IV pilus assembly protein PilN